MSDEYRTVLAPAVGREQFQDLALRAGWRLHIVVQPSAERPYEEVWSINDATSSAHYVEDDRLGAAYVTTMGELSAELADLVRRNLTALTPAEVLVWAYATDDAQDRVRSLGYLAAVAPREPVDAFVAVLESALGDEHLEVRRAALFACVYLSWPQVVPLVEAVRDSDPDEALRTDAGRVLEAIHRYQQPT